MDVNGSRPDSLEAKTEAANSSRCETQISPYSTFNLVVWQKEEKMKANISVWLKDSSYSIFITNDKASLLDQGIKFSPNLIILDHLPPDDSCFTIIPSLHEEYDGPIIILTSHRNVSDLRTGRFLFVEKILFKPITKRHFLWIVEKYATGQNDTDRRNIAVRGIGTSKEKTFLDEAERLHYALLKNGKSKAIFAKKKKISLSRLENEIRIACMPADVKRIIRNYPEVFAKKKSFFCEHLYKIHDDKIVPVLREIVKLEKEDGRYTIEMLKERMQRL